VPATSELRNVGPLPRQLVIYIQINRSHFQHRQFRPIQRYKPINRYKFNQHKSEIDQPAQSTKSNREIHEYDRICRVDPVTRQQVDGYTQLVSDRMSHGWSCHLMTFPFVQLPGPRGAVIQAMKDEIQRVYSMFVTRTHRKPRATPAHDLPVLIGAADLPVYKKDPTFSPLILCNGGLHFQGLLLVPPGTRLEIAVEEHFSEYQDMYLGRRRLITKLDVRPVTETHERAVDYVFKTILRRRVSYDDGVLILPRTRDELGPASERDTIPRGRFYSGKNLISRRSALSSTQSRGRI
jgi:hypothetical protein